MGGRSNPLPSYGVETGKLLFTIFFVKATELLTFLPTTCIPLILGFMLIVFTPMRLIEPFDTIM
ncbi:hypothetical protein LINPERHAP1_LOCUS3972 [Linum perenne]